MRRLFCGEIALSIFDPRRKRSTCGHANRKRRGAVPQPLSKQVSCMNKASDAKLGKIRKELLLIDGMETKMSLIYTMRLSGN